jgi:peptide deformylase
MAILKIARMGHPLLARPAQPVDDPTAPGLRHLVRDMIETMADAEGTGLAAPQVHVPLRVVVFYVTGSRADREERAGEGSEPPEDPKFAVPLTVLINPELEFLTEEMAVGAEACLSVPGLIGQVPRYTRLRYSGFTPDGERLVREAEGFHARVVQHECDHLDGILYPQRMTDLKTLVFTSELGKTHPETEP